jgi:hypothetical protein
MPYSAHVRMSGARSQGPRWRSLRLSREPRQLARRRIVRYRLQRFARFSAGACAVASGQEQRPETNVNFRVVRVESECSTVQLLCLPPVAPSLHLAPEIHQQADIVLLQREAPFQRGGVAHAEAVTLATAIQMRNSRSKPDQRQAAEQRDEGLPHAPGR